MTRRTAAVSAILLRLVHTSKHNSHRTTVYARSIPSVFEFVQSDDCRRRKRHGRCRRDHRSRGARYGAPRSRSEPRVQPALRPLHIN